MNLPPVLRQRYLDSNGNPLAGGKLYTYQTGTTTPQATYTDSGGLTANANPVVLDANGEASMWLDPSLSYKFVLKDSSDVTQWTVDNVVGLLSNNSVGTLSLQDGAVTTIKIADSAVTGAKILSDATIDANRPIIANHIRDGVITRGKFSSTAFIAPAVQKYTSGSGTHNRAYAFVLTSGNATAGATYTNNGVTYTVLYTIAGGTILHASGSAAPTASGTLTKSTGTGDATIAFTSFGVPAYSRVRLVGGGGGGFCGGASGSSYTSGGNTTFGSSLITANGGAAGSNYAYNAGGTGLGGTASVTSPATGLAFQGASGGGVTYFSGTTGYSAGGSGGSSPFGGAGSGGSSQNAGYNAMANTGSGGGGGCGQLGSAGGIGGGAGGYADAIIPSPSATYAYSVGTGGTGASAGPGSNGGNGAAGIIIVEEYFQ